MYKKRLLERIRGANLISQDEVVPFDTYNDEMRSIVEHLNKILTSRSGSVQIAEDYGMPDFTSIQYESVEDTVGVIESLLTNVINKYEPRLQNVIIKFETQDNQTLSLLFKIEATLVSSSRSAIFLKTAVQPEGRFVIREG